MGAAEVQEINRMLASMPSDWVSQLAANRNLLRGAGATEDQIPPARPDAYSVLLALNLNNKDGVSSEAAAGQDPPDGITVPADVKRDAMLGVRESYKNNYGGYNFIGVARAIQLVVSNKISKAAKNRMRMYFDRKTKQDRLSDQFEARKGKRYWSWLNWGGDAGARWSGSSRFAALDLPEERANPVRVFSNPELKDTGFLAVEGHNWSFGGVTLIVYDTRKVGVARHLFSPLSAFVGEIGLDFHRGDPRGPHARVMTGSARKGYGPLLYTLAATLFQCPVRPSEELSQEAREFWEKQPGRQVQPMSVAAFRQRFGSTPDEMRSRANATTDELLEIERWADERVARAHADDPPPVWGEFGPDTEPDYRAERRAAWDARWASNPQRKGSGPGVRAMLKKNPDPAEVMKALQIVPVKERVALAAEPVQIAPDLRMHLQITRTGCRSYIVHWENREMVWLSDAEGRRNMFYRSFSGTSGKTQGRWYVTPGPAETQTGEKLWLVKGSPVKDPGYGRSKLLAFENRVNEVLPHTDEDVDAWITRLTGIDGDFSYKDAFEAQPTFICKDPKIKRGDQFVDQYGSFCVQAWKDSSLDKQWGVRDIPYPENKKNNPIPELVKGAKTKYKDFVAPVDRRMAFEKLLTEKCGLKYPETWYRIGSGEHWVGVCGWDRTALEGGGVMLSYSITLQSGKSWSIAENKVIRWHQGKPANRFEQTGAGGIDFLRFAADDIRRMVGVLTKLHEEALANKQPWTTRYLRVEWPDEKRKRVYGGFLPKLGFTEWSGDEHYGPCFLLVI